MSNKLRVAIIGAGSISQMHIESYQKNPNVEISALCDANEERARIQAELYGIKNYCSDYKEILQNGEIDAVSIVTPTFTHKSIVIEALEAGKHVLCEKPPALNVEEVEECEKVAKKTGKLLMYAFVVRFTKQIQFLKKYIESGAMGDIYYVDITRMERCSMLGGWFVDKEKSGGGVLMDAAIHQIDAALYLMGFPKIKSITGYTSSINSDLPDKMRGIGASWQSADKRKYNRTIESVASGYVLFENGGCMYVKASSILNTVKEGTTFEICGTKAGANWSGNTLNIVSVEDSGYFLESSPVLTQDNDPYQDEVNHFVDCCLNGTTCICVPQHGVEVMKIISSIYESAETKTPVVFS